MIMIPADLKAGIDSADVQARDGGFGPLFIHAGCLSKGRTNYPWGFDVRSRAWSEVQGRDNTYYCEE